MVYSEGLCEWLAGFGEYGCSRSADTKAVPWLLLWHNSRFQHLQAEQWNQDQQSSPSFHVPWSISQSKQCTYYLGFFASCPILVFGRGRLNLKLGWKVLHEHEGSWEVWKPVPHLRIIESYHCLGWKMPLRSSQTISLPLPSVPCS